MTKTDKLIFMGSFVWFMHWGAKLTYIFIDKLVFN